MNLLIRFTNQSTSYAAGVELGRILNKMETGQEIINNMGFPVRIENRDVIAQACTTYGYHASFGAEYFGEWLQFTAIKNHKAN